MERGSGDGRAGKSGMCPSEWWGRGAGDQIAQDLDVQASLKLLSRREWWSKVKTGLPGVRETGDRACS